MASLRTAVVVSLLAGLVLDTGVSPSPRQLSLAEGLDHGSTATFPPIAQVKPDSGPAGLMVGVRGEGWIGLGQCLTDFNLYLYFTDSDSKTFFLRRIPMKDPYRTRVTIPAQAVAGPGSIDVFRLVQSGAHCIQAGVGSASFEVTN